MKLFNQSLQRVFLILEILADYPDGLLLTELSEKTQIHKSTMHRFISDLMELGYVSQLADRRYILTYKLFMLGSSKLKALDIQKIARPILAKLSQDVNEVIHLIVSDLPNIVYIDKIENTDNAITMGSYIGKRSPMIYTASGKALLADLDNSLIEKIWSTTNQGPLTPNSVKTLDELMIQINETRRTRISIDNEENEENLYCVSTTIRDHTNSAVAAISISGPVFRMKAKTGPEMNEKLLQASSEISQTLGGQLG